ncbi:hypothetical protein [Peribacillus sp. SCS-37]|uniref:hypothetical protein n=1 Tax=Paraperibacillus esterisolvens TaxID=3115296 RepID=UPI0039058C04
MTEIAFLASSKPFLIPAEIEEYNNRRIFEREEDAVFFTVWELDEYWKRKIEGLFTMPYVYEVHGLGNRLFLTYVEKYLEMGDVIEIYAVPNQHAFDEYRQHTLSHPEPVEINIGSRTYKDMYGSYKLNPKRLRGDLGSRNYISHFGIATFLNY